MRVKELQCWALKSQVLCLGSGGPLHLSQATVLLVARPVRGACVHVVTGPVVTSFYDVRHTFDSKMVSEC